MPPLLPIPMKRTPIQTPLPHLIRKLGLNPQSTHRTNRKSHHKVTISNMLHLVNHEGNSGQLTPGGRLGEAGGGGGHAGVFAAGGPDFFGLGPDSSFDEMRCCFWRGMDATGERTPVHYTRRHSGAGAVSIESNATVSALSSTFQIKQLFIAGSRTNHLHAVLEIGVDLGDLGRVDHFDCIGLSRENGSGSGEICWRQATSESRWRPKTDRRVQLSPVLDILVK